MRQHHDGVDIVELERPVAAPGIDLPRVGGPLLSSKLAVPPLPAVRVARPRLHDLLDGGGTATVTRVCAPAGWGKTGAVASWVRSRTDRPVAWLSLEPGDDVCSLWSFVHAALGLPASDTVAPVVQHLSGLAEPTMFVLDDFHHLRDAASLDAVEFLVRHGTGRLRLILLTRVNPALPLERWRLAGELVDIGTAELAFTPDETAELLAAHGHRLPDAAVGQLHAHYEGWPAGLSLAGLGIAGSRSTVEVDGIVAAAAPGIRDYLRRELLADQPAALRQAMLRTAILDRLYPDLVAAVTDRADGERIIADLDRRQLIHESPSYRYHRPVADMLRHELSQVAPDDVVGLHRTAAAWHERAGLIGHALRHAMSGRDFPHAVRLVADHWPDLILCPHGTVREAGCGPDEPVSAGPEVELACAAAHIAMGEPTNAARHLGRSGDSLPAARIALDLACARLVGDADAAAAAALRLLDNARSDRLAGASPQTVAVLAASALGTAQLARGDIRAAHETLASTLAKAQRLGLPCPIAICASGLAFLHAVRGQPREADQMARVALAAPPCPGQPTRAHRGYAFAALALLAIERGRFDDAEANLRVAAEADDPVVGQAVSMLWAQLWHERGDAARAHETLLRVHPAPFLRDWYAGLEMAIGLARADPSRGVAPRPAGEGCPRSVRLEVEFIEAVAAHRRGERRAAARTVEQVLAAAQPDGLRRVFARGGTAGRDLLLAHLDSGTAYWATVNELVAAIDSAGPRAPATTELPEALTQREVTVLRYLQSVLSTAEIASDMCVSVNTVKTHVRNIYRKLDTRRRRDAVRRARQLHLL